MEVIVINAGVLSNLIILFLIILISTGWFSTFINNVGSKRTVIIFLLFTYILTFIELPYIFGLRINIGGFILPVIGSVFLLIKVIRKDIIHMLTATFLLGASYFLIKEIIRLDPVLLIVDEKYEIPPLIIAFVIFVIPKLINRIYLIISGIMTGEFIYIYQHQVIFDGFILGSGEARDIMWLAIVEIIILEYFLGGILSFIKNKKYYNLLKLR